MKKIRQINMLLLSLLLSICTMAQLTLGRVTFGYPPAHVLKMRQAIAEGLQAANYLRHVGGVAFDKVAVPADSLHVADMQLTYDPVQADGHRLNLTINGRQAFTSNIYDWQLLPIAQYANSTDFACFTIFGQLQDSLMQDSILNKSGRILNYHPSFQNTLLGLRLFQLDILTIMPNITVDLPKDSGKYLLGRGEQEPDTAINLKGFYKYDSVFYGIDQKYASYVLCDTFRTIEFGLRGDTLAISGEPFVYFFTYNTSQDSVVDRIDETIGRQLLAIRARGTTTQQKHQLQEQWLLKNIHTELKKLDSVNFQNIYKRVIDESRVYRQWYGADDTKLLRDYLLDLKLANYSKSIIYLDKLSTTLSNSPDLFRDINPAVWDAGVMTMRLSAFFRYFKMNYPERWTAFLTSVGGLHTHPAVQTPTTMFY